MLNNFAQIMNFIKKIKYFKFVKILNFLPLIITTKYQVINLYSIIE